MTVPKAGFTLNMNTAYNVPDPLLATTLTCMVAEVPMSFSFPGVI